MYVLADVRCLKVYMIRDMYAKRTADGTIKYQGAAIKPEGKITHIYCEHKETKNKLTGFCLLKDFRVSPRPQCIFADYTPGARIRFLVLFT